MVAFEGLASWLVTVVTCYVGVMTTSIQIDGIFPEWTTSDRVRKARETAGLSQGELAAAVGMSRSGLAAIEQGKSTPRRSTLMAVALGTGVALAWLENGKTPAPDNPGGGSVCAIRGSNPGPTDIGRYALLVA